MDKLRLIDTTGIPSQLLDDGEFYFDLGERFIFEEAERAEELNDINNLNSSAVLGFALKYTHRNLAALEGFRNPNVFGFDYRPLEVVAVSGDRVLRQNLLLVKDFSDADGEFEVELLDERSFWPQAAKELYLNSLDYGSFTWNETNVLSVWPDGVWEDGERDFYLPLVHYGRFYSGTNQTQPEDYRPWFSPAAILQKGFQELGYKFESPLLSLTAFKSLWTYIGAKELIYPGQGESLKIVMQHNTQRGYPSYEATFQRVNHQKLYFDTEIEDPQDRHQAINDPNTTSYFQNAQRIPTTYNFRFEGEFYHDADNDAKFDIIIWLRNENIEIGQIRDIIIPAGETKTIDVNTDAFLKIGADVYITISYITDIVDRDAGFNLWGNAGLKLTMIPSDHRIYRDEEIPLNRFIDPKLTFLDYLKGIMHLGDYKVFTDHVNKKVKIFPSVPGKYLEPEPGASQIEGYLDPSLTAPHTGKLVDRSYSGVLPNRRKKRYMRIQFAESSCEYIKQQGLEEDQPLYSKLIDFGDGDKNEVDENENPLFEPTADTSVERLRIPALWDNDRNQVSWDLAPRVAVFNGYTQHFDSDNTTANIRLVFNFLLGDNLPIISQNYEGFMELGSGPEIPPYAVVYEDPNRDKSYFDFWKWSVRELLYAPIVSFQLFATKAEYNKLSFRGRILIEYRDIPIVGRILEKATFVSGSDSIVQLTLKPEPTNVLEIG